MTAKAIKDAIVVVGGDTWVAAVPHANGWSLVDAYNSPQRFPHDARHPTRGIAEAIRACTAFVDDPKFTDDWRDVYRELRVLLRGRYDEIRPYDPGRP